MIDLEEYYRAIPVLDLDLDWEVVDSQFTSGSVWFAAQIENKRSIFENVRVELYIVGFANSYKIGLRARKSNTGSFVYYKSIRKEVRYRYHVFDLKNIAIQYIDEAVNFVLEHEYL